MEEMVVYRELIADGRIWMRTAVMRDEVIEHNGQQVKRFARKI